MCRRYFRTIAFGILVLAGCSDEREITTPSDQVQTAPSLIPNGTNNPVQQPYPTPSQRIAAQLPQFGGAFRNESGQLTVHLTDLSAQAAAERVISSVLDQIGRGGMQLTFKPVDRAFAQMEIWMEALASSGAPGTAGYGIDERSNTLHVSVLSSSELPKVTALLERLGIPEDAVTLEVTGPISHAQSLQDRQRPLLAGIQT